MDFRAESYTCLLKSQSSCFEWVLLSGKCVKFKPGQGRVWNPDQERNESPLSLVAVAIGADAVSQQVMLMEKEEKVVERGGQAS